MPSPQGASQTAGVNADRAAVAREACCAGPCRSPCAADRGQFRTAAAACSTAQPSLSRQIRDLEYEVGVQLMSRGVQGVELTAAGRAFLDHARLALTQPNAAPDTSRR